MVDFYSISPYVREVKIIDVYPLFGEWQDFDNVFTYIQSGEANYFIDGNLRHVEKGDIIVLHPFRKHVIQTLPGSQLTQFIFHFDLVYTGNNIPREQIYSTRVHHGSTGEHIDESERFFINRPFIAKLTQADCSTIEKSFIEMLVEYNLKKTGYEIMLKSKALELILLFLRNLDDEKINRTLPTSKAWLGIEHAIEIINNYYFDPDLDIKYISKKIDLTPNYLSGIFMKLLNTTVHRYIVHVRLKNAKKLMLFSNMNFSEIANSVGFSSIHTFSKVFKRVTKKTPTEYISMKAEGITQRLSEMSM